MRCSRQEDGRCGATRRGAGEEAGVSPGSRHASAAMPRYGALPRARKRVVAGFILPPAATSSGVLTPHAVGGRTCGVVVGQRNDVRRRGRRRRLGLQRGPNAPREPANRASAATLAFTRAGRQFRHGVELIASGPDRACGSPRPTRARIIASASSRKPVSADIARASHASKIIKKTRGVRSWSGSLTRSCVRWGCFAGDPSLGYTPRP